MSYYNELLIRAILGISFTWILASVFFNHRIDQLKKQHREIRNAQFDELRRLRQMNAELSFEVSKLRGKK